MTCPRIFLMRQEVDDVHPDKISGDLKNPAVIELDSCDIKPVSLLNIFQKRSTLKTPNGII